MDTALLLVDIQNDYFPGGKLELAGSPGACQQAALLLQAFRGAGLPVIHVQHLATRPGATFFIPGTPGAEIAPSLEPLPGEAVVEKHFPNSFRETTLLDLLHQKGIHRLVIAGMQTSMCIDATTRAAADLGFECLVAGDACAARDLTYGGLIVPAAHVHAAYLASLNGSYGKVLPVQAILEQLDLK